MSTVDPQPPSIAAPSGLVRGVARWALVAVTINAILGAGIFGLPSKVHALAGPHGLLAFAACGVVVASIALCFAEVSSRFTATGGPYLYTQHTFGPVAGFVVGWLLWLTRMTSVAAIANVMASYLAYFWPPAAGGVERALATSVAIVLLTAINLAGVKQAARTATAFTVVKVAALLGFIAIGAFAVDPARFTGVEPPSASDFSQAVLLLIFAFGGFEGAVVVGGESKDPRRDVPFAVVVAIGTVLVIYVLIQAVCIGTLPELASSTKPLVDASALFMGAAGAAAITCAALVSTSGTMFATLFVAPRVLFAMAEARQIPAVFARTHPRTHSPSVAILASGVVGLVLAASGTFTYLASLSTITRLVIYVTTAAALLVLRRRGGEVPAQFTVRGGGFVAVFAIVACVWLMSTSRLQDLRDVAVAVAIGFALYAGTRAWSRRTSNES